MWWKGDDNLPFHPKIARCSVGAVWLYIGGLAHSSRHLTDGFIDDAFLHSLILPKHVVTTIEEHIQELVREGLWERVDGGFLVHDFLEYNPSRARVQERRARDRERQHKHRNPGVTEDDERDPEPVSRRDTGRESRRSRPVPSRPKEEREQPPAAAGSASAPPARSRSDAPTTPETDRQARPLPNGDIGPAAKPTRKRDAKPAEPTHPNRQAVMRLVDEFLEPVLGCKIPWSGRTGGRFRQIADDLARDHSLELIRERLHRLYVERRPRRLWENGVPGLALFAQAFVDIVDPPPKTATSTPPLMVPPQRPPDVGVGRPKYDPSMFDDVPSEGVQHVP